MRVSACVRVRVRVRVRALWQLHPTCAWSMTRTVVAIEPLVAHAEPQVASPMP